MGNLNGKVAAITGAGQGIGRAIALRLAEDGADIAVCDINEKTGKKVADEVLKKGRQSLFVKVEVTNSKMVKDMVKKIIDRFGKINIFVANAAISQVKKFLDITEDDWNKMIATNLTSVFLTDKAVIPYMQKQGGGKIINAASIVGKQGAALFSHYSAAKFGVIGLTQALAKELAEDNITVNAYCPGIVDTPMWKVGEEGVSKIWGIKPEDATKKYIENTLLKRLTKPEEIAGLVSFLASEDANFMTGQSVVLDGGICII